MERMAKTADGRARQRKAGKGGSSRTSRPAQEKAPQKTRQVTLSVFRFDPARKEDGGYKTYMLDAPENYTLLDCLIHIKDHVDETLAFRKNCRNAICGSCAMRVNGHAVLACKEHIHELARRHDGDIRVSPMGNMPAIKDLVVDMTMFWNRLRAIRPYLLGRVPEPEKEYLMSPQEREKLVQVAGCIQCGACYSDCNSVDAEPKFFGPAALAKLYRYAADSRDAAGRERLAVSESPHGSWDCTHCFACIEVCPMGVAPMDQILRLRRIAMDAGFKSAGQRHHDSFDKSIRKSGWLDELRLPLESAGIDIAEQLRLVPVGVRMMLHHKMPHLLHTPIPGQIEIRHIYDATKDGGSANEEKKTEERHDGR